MFWPLPSLLTLQGLSGSYSIRRAVVTGLVGLGPEGGPEGSGMQGATCALPDTTLNPFHLCWVGVRAADRTHFPCASEHKHF
jgi:hypothetical protein